MSEEGITREELKKYPAKVHQVLGGDITADPLPLSDEGCLAFRKEVVISMRNLNQTSAMHQIVMEAAHDMFHRVGCNPGKDRNFLPIYVPDAFRCGQ